MKKERVAHLTSVHTRFDTRIFLKECRSLVAAGYDVSLVVADGNGDEVKDGVQIYDVGYTPGRLKRITVKSRQVLARALELDVDLYHLHDPELLSIVGRLRRGGKIVIFDAHEDVPLQIMSKYYLHQWVRRCLSKLYAAYETRTCRGLDAVVAATPFIRDKFLAINSCSVDINNYPIVDELVTPAMDCEDFGNQVCYIGGISAGRGIREMVRAMEIRRCDARLSLGGRFEDKRVRSELESYAGWTQVDDLGWLDRQQVRQVLFESAGGLVTLLPLPNYIDAHPVKMFEYMSASLPVIASNFPLWREIIEGSDCGICVDPGDPQAIADAIDYLVQNPERAQQMGTNGLKAVRERYNWSIEEKKLISLYERLSHKGRA